MVKGKAELELNHSNYAMDSEKNRGFSLIKGLELKIFVFSCVYVGEGVVLEYQ